MRHCVGFVRNKWIVSSDSQVTIKDFTHIAIVNRSQGAKAGKPGGGICCSLIGLHPHVLAGGSPQWMTCVSHRLHSNVIQAVYPVIVERQGCHSDMCDKALLGPWH